MDDDQVESLLNRLRDPATEAVAWDEFVAFFRPQIFTAARRLTLNFDDAEDLVQETLLRTFQKLSHVVYHDKKQFVGWLRRLCVNCYRNQTRHRLPITISDEALDDLSNQVEDDLSHEIDNRWHSLISAFDSVSDDFNKNTWLVLWKTVYDSLSTAQVARDLGMTPGAVRGAKWRLLHRLRQELGLCKTVPPHQPPPQARGA